MQLLLLAIYTPTRSIETKVTTKMVGSASISKKCGEIISQVRLVRPFQRWSGADPPGVLLVVTLESLVGCLVKLQSLLHSIWCTHLLQDSLTCMGKFAPPLQMSPLWCRCTNSRVWSNNNSYCTCMSLQPLPPHPMQWWLYPPTSLHIPCSDAMPYSASHSVVWI